MHNCAYMRVQMTQQILHSRIPTWNAKRPFEGESSFPGSMLFSECSFEQRSGSCQGAVNFQQRHLAERDVELALGLHLIELRPLDGAEVTWEVTKEFGFDMSLCMFFSQLLYTIV